MINLISEIEFQSSRSGGKGGQNVNKVETAVMGSFHVENSSLLSPEQKQLILEKLSNRINQAGYLQVRSQEHRTQLSNKEEVLKKLNQLVFQALKKKKARIATKASRASKEKRLDSKKRKSAIKEGRQKWKSSD